MYSDCQCLFPFQKREGSTATNGWKGTHLGLLPAQFALQRRNLALQLLLFALPSLLALGDGGVHLYPELGPETIFALRPGRGQQVPAELTYMQTPTRLNQIYHIILRLSALKVFEPETYDNVLKINNCATCLKSLAKLLKVTCCAGAILQLSFILTFTPVIFQEYYKSEGIVIFAEAFSGRPHLFLGVPLALLEETPLCIQSALLQHFLLQPMLVSSQGCNLPLLPVTLPLCLLLYPGQSTAGLLELVLQAGTVGSGRGRSFGGRLFFLVSLLHRRLQPTYLTAQRPFPAPKR